MEHSNGHQPTTCQRDQIENQYGVTYIEPGVQRTIEAHEDDLYFYTLFTGHHRIPVPRGDSLFVLDRNLHSAAVVRGPTEVESHHVATLIRGYMPQPRHASLRGTTCLPYVNGCSTRQLLPAERPGDPTLQMLLLPPHTQEQAHHIHSTVRVVYVLEGEGHCVVGMPGRTTREHLHPGKVILLEAMCPHHFETGEKALKVIPLHVFSSVGGGEFNHPMFNGTHLLER